MSYREYDQFVKAQEVVGFTRGYGFDEFKKGEQVWFFFSKRPVDELELVEGKIVSLIKEKNAKGELRIFKIEVEIENQIRSFNGVQQIKNHLFKQDEKPSNVSMVEEVIEPKETVAVAPVTAAEPEVVVSGDIETMIVEKAMTEKNKKIRKLVAEGWTFKGSVWSSEMNMYLATMERAIGGNVG